MSEPVVFGLAVATVLVQAALLLGALRWLLRFAGILVAVAPLQRLDVLISRYRLPLTLLFALTATLGSLYLSNVLGWEPCQLCWFQRIFMYPLVVLFPVAILLEKDDVRDYALALAMPGIALALYHYAVQRWEQFHAAGCSVLAISCSTKYTFYFGYVTVPMMAATAFAAIIVLLWRYR